jgi:hypothetical protein
MNLQFAKKLYSQLWSAYQSSQESIDRDLTTYIDPSRGVYSITENRSTKLDGQTLVDTKPCMAVEAYASGFMSYMTDPTKVWFKIQMGNQDGEESEPYEDQEVVDFLNRVGTQIRRIFAGSNIYPELLNIFAEHGVFGRGVFILTYDPETIIRATFYTAGTYCLGKNARGEIDQFACKMRKTAAQIIDEFGRDALPATILNAYDSGSHSNYYDLYWMITPNTNIQTNTNDFRSMKWLSLKWVTVENTNRFVSESGFDAFPAITARYYPKDNTQIYGGKYPGWGALSASKQLQAQVRSGNRIDDWNANPAMANYGNIDIEGLFPGGIVQFDLGMAQASGGKFGLEPIMPYRDSSYLETKSERLRREIDRWFLVDFFQLLNSMGTPNMTLGEVNMRYSEMVKSIAPQIMGIESCLRNLLDVTMHILTSNWVIIDSKNMTILEALCGEIPESIQGADIKQDNYKLIGILSIIQQAAETLPDEQLLQFTVYLASSLQDQIKNPVDLLDGDEILRAYADRIGRGNVLRGADVVNQMRETRQQAMSEQQQQMDAQNSIQAAQAMANTPIAENTALSAVMGNQ